MNDVEALQSLGDMPGNLANGEATPMAIVISKAIEQVRRGAGERHFEME